MKLPATRSLSTIIVLVAAILLPNLFAIIALTMGIGTPPRTAAILFYAVPSLIARIGHPVLAILLLIVFVIYDIVNTICLMFSLSVVEFFSALRYVKEVQYFSSPLYVALGVTILTTTFATAFILLRCQRQFKTASLLPAMAMIVALAGIDFQINNLPYYSYRPIIDQDQDFSSAMIQSGFEHKISDTNLNVLLVLVEGLGRLSDDTLQSLIFKPINNPKIEARYHINEGETRYFGSTTSAEMRELCASYQSYTTLNTEKLPIDCLPSRLAQQGFTTLAFHAFTARFFGRNDWYPQVGFQQIYFGEELQPKMARTCGAVWLGACDTDVANELATTLRTQNGPLMAYWLTLNTHIPISPGEGTARYNCNTPASMFSDPEVCWMAEMWTDVMESIARLALDPALPPMAILVAGDHAPPLWSRKARRLFRPGEVSWISLWPHPSVGPDHSHQATASGSH